jgi:PAS domain S-box-containing protein
MSRRPNAWHLPRLRLETRVTLCVALVQVFLLVLAGILHLRAERRNLLSTVEWRSRALARSLQKRVVSLSGYSPEMQRTLGLTIDCQVLLGDNVDSGLAYVGVIGPDGRVIAHTDPDRSSQIERAEVVLELFNGAEAQATLGPEASATFIPVTTAPDSPPVAVIDVGFSRRAIDHEIRNTIAYSISAFVVFLLLSFLLIGAFLRRFVTRPVTALSQAAADFAHGQRATDLDITGSDEVELLAGSLNHMRREIQRQFGDLEREISDRKEAERLLSKSEEDLRVTLDSIGDAVIATDVQGGIIRMNPVAEQLTGWGAEEAEGKPLDQVFRIVNVRSREVVENPTQKVLATGEVVGLANHTALVSRDGTERQIADSGAPIRSSEGEVVGVVLVFRDVTEEYALQERLHQGEKMDAIGQLAGGVAHDFNNMLGAILGHAELAMEEMTPDQPAFDNLQEIHGAAEHSADLTRQLLAFARKQTVAPMALDLNEVVGKMLKMLRPLIGEDIDLVWRPAAALWPIKMDSSQIDQILANLCVNARDAIGGAGRLSIETGNCSFDEDYCVEHPGATPGGFVRLVVSDTGCGMDKETLAQVFDPFFTTKGVGEGTGMGLAMVYGAVKQNDGFISADSEPGRGSTFAIYLPRHASGEARPAKTDRAARLAHGGATILLVEDEPSILRMASAMLQRQGHTVLTAATPDEALRLGQQHTGTLDLLMTDVVMPGMNGRDLARDLLALCPDLECLFMSGYPANVIARHGVLEGGPNFIQKPFTTRELREKIREVLGGPPTAEETPLT